MVIKKELANAIRALSIDAVEIANSGHPGAPMGMADMAEVLWNDFLSYNPQDPTWFNRDRFVLSNGHASMLLYSLLHLSGYDLSLEDIKKFRQLHSKTAGHPEYHLEDKDGNLIKNFGIETTTGPLGQGFANAVGMALAEKLLAHEFNKTGFNLVDHKTYCVVGDGCLMEGISHEAASFAGAYSLNKLIVIWDDNGISIDGEVSGWFVENIPQRFQAYGWEVIENIDGHDSGAVQKALKVAQTSDKPVLICAKTTIGFGSPNKANSAKSHGSALGSDEIALVKKELGVDYPAFKIPQEIYQAFQANSNNEAAYTTWQKLLESYKLNYPEEYVNFRRRTNDELPIEFEESLQNFCKDISLNALATRKSSQFAIEKFSSIMPEFLGGSADLTGSNNTNWSKSKTLLASEIKDNFGGNYISYGVREFGMAAIMNGVALHKGFLPFGGTFLVFSDYMRNAIRMSALMSLRVIYVLTHDSIGLGEDGPTHQPIEHLSSLRLIPNLSVWRPADTLETLVAWKLAIANFTQPTALILSRQDLKQLDSYREDASKAIALIEKGGYILCKEKQALKLVVLATGSEVELAIALAEYWDNKKVGVRVVSMPSMDLFDRQTDEYKKEVLADKIPKMAIEAGTEDLWYKYVGTNDNKNIMGINSFGKSAPAADLFEEYGLTLATAIKLSEKLFKN